VPNASDGINGLPAGGYDLNVARAAAQLVIRLAYLSVGAARNEAERTLYKIFQEARRHANYQQFLERIRDHLAPNEQVVLNNLIQDRAGTGWFDP